MSNANKLSKNSSKSKAPNSQSKRKGCFIFYIINILFDGLNSLTHLIHIKPYGIFTSTCLAHTHIFTELLKFFVQGFIHTDIQIFDFLLITFLFHIGNLTTSYFIILLYCDCNLIILHHIKERVIGNIIIL